MEGYIYILIYSLFEKYDFKVGSTENPYGRYQSYGGYFTRGKYKFKYLIKINSVQETYKKINTNLKDIEYVEKEIIHDHFKNYPVKNDTIEGKKTEWFNNFR